MHRFYLPPDQSQGTTLVLSAGEAHHALHVLRIRRGEKVTVLDGQGLIRECEVQESTRDGVVVKTLEQRRVAPLPCQITLAQAIPKGKLIESIIQKATELGASRIVPLITERTIARFEPRQQTAKAAKWQQVAIEAIKQCGSAWLPQVEPATTLEHFVSRFDSAELSLVGSLRKNARHPRIYFQEFRRKHDRHPESISVAIGPEGDFTERELGALESAGYLPITLGPLVLRTETAATYCLSVLNYELS
jgi:16S rRNA (uracil1498-N3)-methyltransferase